MENKSSFEIQNLTVHFAYSSPSSGSISNSGSISYSPGVYNSENFQFTDFKPGERREFSRRTVEKISEYYIDSIEGVLSDGRPFRQEISKPFFSAGGSHSGFKTMSLCCIFGGISAGIAILFTQFNQPYWWAVLAFWGGIPLIIGIVIYIWSQTDWT